MLKNSADKSFSGSAVFALLVLLLIGSLTTDADAAVLANHNKRGLRAYTIDGVLRLPEEEIDLGTAALILSRDWGTNRTSHVYRRKIDDMAEEILKRLKDQHLRADYRAIPVINKYLFEELGFTAVDNADDPEDLFLHVVVEKKRGYCLSLSVLYLALAERVGLPMCGVVVPGHFFVRYDDGRHRYNIEATSGGAIVADEHYIEKFKPPKQLQSLYMKNLTKKQTLGCFFNNLGNCYLSRGDTQKAFEILSDAVRINPLLSEAHMNLGNIYLQRQMPHEAVAKYEAALSILGHDAHAFNNLGSAFLQLEDYRKAESYYKTALSLEPDNIDACRNLGQVYWLQDKAQAAIDQLQSVLNMMPDDTESMVLLGRIHQKQGNVDAALRLFEKVIRYESANASARKALGNLYLENNQPAAALRHFQVVVDYHGDDVGAWFGTAQAYHDLEKTEKEIWAYENVLEISPDLVPALQNVGNAYMKQQMHHQAIDVYRKAVKLEPENADLHFNLAVVLAKTEQHQQAVTEFLKAIQYDPAAVSAYHGAAISYYQLGEYEFAKSYAQKAKAGGIKVDDRLLNP